MKLSKRLLTIASMIPQGIPCADIGSDHGLLVEYLLNNKLVPFAYASDNKKGPFSRLNENLKKYIDLGYDIISMSISSKISGTFNIANLARNQVLEEYPDANIYCFDSLRMSGSFGILVIYALELQKEGKSFDEVINWLEENKVKVHQMGPIDDLTFVARRGQISKGKAIMGNFVGIKPMGDCNTEGYVTVLAKTKGIKKALNSTVSYIEKIGTNLENQYIIIAHSDREDYANLLKEKIEEKLKVKKVFVTDVFSGCGTNIGPGMIGAYFIGNTISTDCLVEKEALIQSIKENTK